MIFYLISPLINALTSSLVGIIALTRNSKSPLNRTFSYFAFSVAFWSSCYTVWQAAKDAQSALFWCRALMAGAILIPITFFHFIATLIGKQERYSKRIIFWYAVCVVFLILDFTPLFVKDIRPRLFFPYWPTAGIAYTPYLGVFLGLMLYSQVLMYKHWRKFSGFERNRIKYVFLGTIIGFLGGLTNFPLWYDIPIPPVGNVLVAVYVFIVFYELIKCRLMDINLMIRKAAVYSVIYGLIIGIFAVVVNLCGQLMVYRHLDSKFYLVSFFVVIIISVLPKPLDSLLTALTDKIFFRKKYAYQETLRSASQGMTKIRNLPKLQDLIVRVIVNSVRVTHATVFLADKERPIYVVVASKGKLKAPKGFIRNNTSSPLVNWLLKKKEPLVYDEIVTRLKKEPNLKLNVRASYEKIAKEMQDLNASVCIPSFMEEKLIGFLLLGEKLSGDMYTQEDLNMFLTLANQAALAIENAQAYEELKDSREQLLQAERLATIGKFANEVAHEIKNPLQAIRTFVEYLPQKYAEEGFRERFTKVVGGEIERIDNFVRQLVGFSRPKPLEFSPVDINQLLDTTLLLLENDFRKNKILIKRNYFKKDIRLLADRNQLKQVFLNLFLNSLEAMNGTKPNQLTVETSSEHHELVVRIADTGCGISKEDLSHLFEPFFTTKEKGMGIGLTVVKSIIQNHNGKISLESKLGEGTTVSISLPYVTKK